MLMRNTTQSSHSIYLTNKRRERFLTNFPKEICPCCSAVEINLVNLSITR